MSISGHGGGPLPHLQAQWWEGCRKPVGHGAASNSDPREGKVSDRAGGLRTICRRGRGHGRFC